MICPNLVHHTPDRAISQLTAAGLTVGQQSSVRTRVQANDGLVVAQLPAAGKTVESGHAVSFQVGVFTG
jgi:beta-lactam-binding protein with PASTA domain